MGSEVTLDNFNVTVRVNQFDFELDPALKDEVNSKLDGLVDIEIFTTDGSNYTVEDMDIFSGLNGNNYQEFYED